MSSHTFFDEILAEAKNNNPDASPEEILDALVMTLEREILPEVLQDLTLPRFPTMFDIVLSESRGRLRKKKFEPTRTMRERRATIQQVEGLKRQLSWDGSNGFRHVPYFSGADNIEVLPKRLISPTRRMPEPYVEKTKIPVAEKIDDPYPRIATPPRTKNQILLSEEFQKKILSDPFLESAFKSIEEEMRSLISSRNLETDIAVTSLSDFEIPSWKKNVITINPLPSIDFKERIKVWTLFDITIRSKIAALMKDADEKTKSYLTNLNKSLFLHIEL